MTDAPLAIAIAVWALIAMGGRIGLLTTGELDVVGLPMVSLGTVRIRIGT
jgi:hypothetical protein